MNTALKFIFPSILWNKNTDEPAVYLTFDDGPDPDYTPRVLDILAQNKISATFFLLGGKSYNSPALTKRIAAEGHTIGLHGYEHDSHLFKSGRYLNDSIVRTQKIITDTTLKLPLLFRPPYGHFSPRLMRICGKLSIKIVLWSIMSKDFNVRIPDVAIHSNIKRQLKHGSIIVFHDGHINSERTIQILPDVIKNIRNAGYRFAAL